MLQQPEASVPSGIDAPQVDNVVVAQPVTDLRERLSASPELDTLLRALTGLAPSFLVGGAVRDLLRGETSMDLDVAVEGDAVIMARELAQRLDGEASEHERFGTATVRAGGLSVDLATTRRERYERPGALPVVEPAGLDEDLGRRDFTVNAMALALTGPSAGQLHDPHGGRADLEAGLVRVLHERSFIDDPTRLLRALRYEARLGFTLEARTERLAREAAAAGALATVSGPRVRDELMELLAESRAAHAVDRLGELGIAAALHPGLRADRELIERSALGAAQAGASQALTGLAALCSDAPGELAGFVSSLGLAATARDAVLRAAHRGPALADSLRTGARPSEIHELLAAEPPEALALGLAFGAPGEPVLHFLSELRGARLEITGDDLVAAGVPPSPAVGRALRETLRRKLDGELEGHEAELRVALELAAGGR